MKKQSRKMPKKHLALIFIPFLSTICYLTYLLFTGRYYKKSCLLSLLKACLVTFASGVALGIIGLFSYSATAIISFVVIGILMNFVFFRSYNNMVDQ